MRDARHHDSHGRARDRRLELITGSKRRRARSAREKAAIVAETFAPGAYVPEIARRHGLNRGLLFSWRRQVRRARPSPAAEQNLPLLERLAVTVALTGAAVDDRGALLAFAIDVRP